MGNSRTETGRTRRRPNASVAIWCLSVFTALVTAVLFATVLRDLEPLGTSFRLPWWALAALFVVAEVNAVHLRFRTNAHSFSMGEIPLVIGLFAASPVHLVIGQFIGSSIALGVHRRQSPLKLTFNVANLCLQATLAVIVFRLVVPSQLEPGPWAWAGAALATTTALLAADVLINAAIYLTGGKLKLSSITDVFGLGFAASMMNTSLALVAITILWRDPASAWLAVIPPVILYLAYHAYTSQREDHDRLGSLYEATRTLHRTPEIETAMQVAVGQARRLFQAEMAEIILMPAGREDRALSTFHGEEGDDGVLVPLDADLGRELWDDVVTKDIAILVPRRSKISVAPSYFEMRGIEDAIIAPLHGNGPVGAIVVANRLGDISTFDLEDLKLLETLSQHVSVSLENGRLEDSLDQVTRLKEELRHQALHDALTGLANRTLFMERVEHALELRRRSGRGTAVLFVDLDDFKAVNDTLGHAVGDELLMEVSRRLRRCIRTSDTAARFGGDEFAVLLEDFSDESDPVVAARRILVELEAPFIAGHRQMPIGASVGVAIASPGIDSDEIMRQADLAMYIAKREGKGRYRVFEQDTHSEVSSRLELKTDLVGAAERGEFSLQYQPIIDLSSGVITGVEALLRWNHPTRGSIPPDTFISLAEETGQIVSIGRWVIDESCTQVASWEQQFGMPLMLSVNVSARQLLEPSLVEDIARSLQASGLDPQRLIVEITESVLVPGVEAAASTIADIKDLGARVAIDDFGTGYSSLSYLERYPVDFIKIDKSFVWRLGGDNESGLARAVIELGSSLGVATIAEGIEDQEQLERLMELGCQRGQGFLFSKPVDSGDMESVLVECRKSAMTALSKALFDETPELQLVIDALDEA